MWRLLKNEVKCKEMLAKSHSDKQNRRSYVRFLIGFQCNSIALKLKRSVLLNINAAYCLPPYKCLNYFFKQNIKEFKALSVLTYVLNYFATNFSHNYINTKF